MKNGKIWGITQLLEENGVLEFHRIEGKAGGVCSKHFHRYKWNGFFVESGELLIRIWKNNYDLIDEILLKAGDYTKVAPNEYHQFEVIKDCIAFELYWAEFSCNDIIRESVGYKNKK